MVLLCLISRLNLALSLSTSIKEGPGHYSVAAMGSWLLLLTWYDYGRSCSSQYRHAISLTMPTSVERKAFRAIWWM